MIDPTPDPGTIVQAFVAARDAYNSARIDMAKAEEALKTAILYHHDMSDRAIPSGNGHFWIIRREPNGNLFIQHTASMEINNE
jgi:hypothetical protein